MTEDEIKNALIQCFTEKKDCRITYRDSNDIERMVIIHAYTLNIFGFSITGQSAENEEVSIQLESIIKAEVYTP